MTDAPSPAILLLIGVSGVGKTSVGRAVAARLGWLFFDADDLHSSANVAKMAWGEGLTDADRAPWLDTVRRLIERRLKEGAPTVVACSALKETYRTRLRNGLPAVRLVWLDASPEDVTERLNAREGHFAGPELLASQRATLEPPSPYEAVRIEASGTIDDTARRVIAALGLEAAGGGSEG